MDTSRTGARNAAQRATIDFPASDEFVIRLSGKLICDCKIKGLHGRNVADLVKLTQTSEPAEPMFLGYPHGPKTADWVPTSETKTTWRITLPADLKVSGFVPAGTERRPAMLSPSAAISSTFGPAVSTLDDSVYDRSGDWLVTVHSGVERSDTGFSFSGANGEIDIRPDYFKDHLGYFLWDRSKPLWSRSVAGWCSWAAYGQDVTQANVENAAAFFSKNLRDYGYKVIQIDDGYQRVRQVTDNHQPITEPFAQYWTTPNEKFPLGMEHLAWTINRLGMTPGIWIGLYLPLGLKHADNYVQGPDGKALQGPWVGYSMDSGKPDAVAEAYTDALKTFRKQGWRYFKIDTLRHILYDSYRRAPEFWAARGTDSSHAYRRLFEAVRAAVGRENYLLACWGALPELAGLPDGCRIGEDVGPDFDSMRRSAKYIAQFHYANNVIWRDDPDYMCLRVPLEQCKTWATLTSLTGEHVMVSDPVETYDADRVDVLRRVGPPCVTHPENLTPMAPDPEWLTLHGAKNGETWTVASRMAWKPLDPVNKPLGELGLHANRTYLAFDFWNSMFLGEVSGACPFGALGQGECQVIGLRPLTALPQVLGDDRHISQGGYELNNVRWDGHKLSGSFECTTGREWHLFIYVPTGYVLAPAANAGFVAPNVWRISFPNASGWQKWSVGFK